MLDWRMVTVESEERLAKAIGYIPTAAFPTEKRCGGGEIVERGVRGRRIVSLSLSRSK
jgi:hypothetical protein